MSVRINVILPEETVRMLDRVAPKGSRSRLISDAVMHHVSSRGRSNPAEQLKAGALASAKRDLAIAEEWFPLEEEAWQRHQKPGSKAKNQVSPRGDIYLVSFDPTVGAEIQKTRPALVIQNDIGNQRR